MEDPCYSYLHFDLLDKITLTMVTLEVKLPFIELHELFLQNGIYVKLENFGIE
jgi:hypothetical protein